MMDNEWRMVSAASILEQQQSLLKVEEDIKNDYMDKLYRCEASPAEAEEFYYGVDPLHTNFFLQLDIAHAEKNFPAVKELSAELLTESWAIARGGLTIAASIFCPEAFDASEQTEDWAEKVYEDYYKPRMNNGDLPDANKLTPGALVDLLYSMVEEHSVKTDASNLSKLYIAAEMLQMSTKDLVVDFKSGDLIPVEDAADYDEISEKIYDTHGPRAKILFGVSESRLDEILGKQSVIGDAIFHYIADHSAVNFEQSKELDVADELTMLALKAETMLASHYMSSRYAETLPEYEGTPQKSFIALLGALQTVFDSEDRTIHTRLKSPQIKGNLHEILWYMDAFVLRKLRPEDYGNIYAYPGYTRNDSPRIDYPKQKRSIDVIVEKVDGDTTITDYVQLKSSPSKKASRMGGQIGHILNQENGEKHPLRNGDEDEYHPVIKLLHEENFQEVDYRRLRAKIITYRRWAEADFRRDAANKVEGYVLKSVRKELDSIKNREEDTQMAVRKWLGEFVISAMKESGSFKVHDCNEMPRLNRAQRRAIEKSKNKKNRKKSLY